MRIYRLEHAVSGQGPYGSWPRRYKAFSPEWQAGEDALVFPGNGSGGFAGMPEDARSGMHPLCGCTSVAALRAWFGRAWPYLVASGFVLVEYEAARRFTHFPDEYRSNGEVMVARNAVRRIRATLLSDKLRQDVAALEEHMGGFNVASLRWYASRELTHFWLAPYVSVWVRLSLDPTECDPPIIVVARSRCRASLRITI